MPHDKMHKVTGETYGHDMPVMLPSFSLTEKDLPVIKNWTVGKKYTLVMEVEQVSMSKDEYGKSPMTARFKVHKVGEKEIMGEDEKKARMGRY